MTVAESQPPDPAEAAPDEPAAETPEIIQCPYLTSSDGSWRRATAARDHRCAAVSPPAPLTIEKQRRLCLTSEHVGCATFVAAETASGALPGRAAGLPRPVVRTTPVILDEGRFGGTLPTMLADRSIGQAGVVAGLGVAVLVLVIARSAMGGAFAGASPSPVPSATPSPTPTAKPSPTPRPTPTPRVTPTPSTTPAPSTRASARPRTTPRPSARTTPRPTRKGSVDGSDSPLEDLFAAVGSNARDPVTSREEIWTMGGLVLRIAAVRP